MRMSIRFICIICVTVVGFFASHHAYAQQSTSSFSFALAGDFSSTSNTDTVLNGIKGSGANFVLAVGDLSYDTQGNPAGWGTYLKNIIGTLPFAFVMGNHDASQVDAFAAALPNSLSAQGTYGKQYYFDYPATSPLARFIMMSPVDGTKDINWLNTTIDSARSANIKWIIVGMHQPCITIGEKTCESGQDVMDAIIAKKVDLAVYGHDHNYQRSKQLSCAKSGSFNASCVVASGTSFKKGAGTVVLISGTGGNGLYAVNKSKADAGYFEVTNSDTWGYSKITVSATELQETFVKTAGGTLSDSFTISDSATAPSGTPSTIPATSTAPGVIQPSFYPLAPCPTCSSPNEPSVSGGVSPASTYPSTAATAPAISENPGGTECSADSAYTDNKRHKKHHHKKGGIGNSIDIILEFLLKLINLLLQLLGGAPVTMPNNPSEPTTTCPTQQPSTALPTDSPPVSVEPQITSNPVPSEVVPSTAAPSGAAAASGITKDVQITFYGAYDNDPKGSTDISSPVIHQKAGGTGTYADPLTFASPTGAGEYAVGAKIYVPLVQKYFVREDTCATSWTAPNGCGEVSHVDLYVGNPSDSEAVVACENSLTPSGEKGGIIVDPPANLPVDASPIWDQASGKCMTPHQ